MKKLLLAIIISVLTVSTVYSYLPGNIFTRYNSINAAVSAGDTLNFLPDSDTVIVFDTNRFLQSNLFKSIIQDPKANKEFKDMENQARQFGVDINQLREIAIGMNIDASMKSETKFCIVASGSFDREKILSTIASSPKKIAVQSEEYNGKTLYTVVPDDKDNSHVGKVMKLDKQFGVAFLTPQIVALGNIEKVKDSIDVQAGKQPSALSNQEIASYITSTNSSAMLRFAGKLDAHRNVEAATSKPNTAKKSKVLTNESLGAPEPSEKPNNQAASSSEPEYVTMLKSIRAFHGSLDFYSGFQLDTTVITHNEGEGKKLYDGVNGMVSLGRFALGQDPKNAQFMEILNKVNLINNGKEIKLNIDVPEALLNQILNEIKKNSPGK